MPDVEQNGVNTVGAVQLDAAKAVLNELLAAASGVVPLKKVKDGLIAKGILDAGTVIGQLRMQDVDVLGHRIYFVKNKIFTAEAYAAFQDKAAKAAEEAADQHIITLEPAAETTEILETSPKKREHRQEEARLVSYLKPAMEEVYLSDIKPDSEGSARLVVQK